MAVIGVVTAEQLGGTSVVRLGEDFTRDERHLAAEPRRVLLRNPPSFEIDAEPADVGRIAALDAQAHRDEPRFMTRELVDHRTGAVAAHEPWRASEEPGGKRHEGFVAPVAVGGVEDPDLRRDLRVVVAVGLKGSLQRLDVLREEGGVEAPRLAPDGPPGPGDGGEAGGESPCTQRIDPLDVDALHAPGPVGIDRDGRYPGRVRRGRRVRSGRHEGAGGMRIARDDEHEEERDGAEHPD